MRQNVIFNKLNNTPVEFLFSLVKCQKKPQTQCLFTNKLNVNLFFNTASVDCDRKQSN